MAARLAPLALVVLAHGVVGHTMPPRQTAYQKSYMAALRTSATAASAAATPAVLAFLDSAPFRANLTRALPNRPDIAKETAAQLLRRMRGGAAVSELTHNFFDGHNRVQTWEDDMDLDIAAAIPYLMNLWTLSFLNYTTKFQPDGDENDAETTVLRFRNFSRPSAGPTTLAEATERPLYTAMNRYRVDIGKPIFGNIAIVVNRTSLDDMVVVSPMDTGLWNEGCNEGKPDVKVTCSSWDRELGTLDQLDHLWLAGGALWRNPAQLADVFARQYGDVDGAAADPLLISGSDVIQFFEADVVGTLSWDMVSGIVADFPTLFGTPTGKKLRAWCVKQAWPLQWALGANVGNATQNSEHSHFPKFAAVGRMLDPHALGGVNVSASAAAVAAFDKAWASAAAFPRPVANTTYLTLWRTQGLGPLRTAPLRAGDCVAPGRCVGVSVAERAGVRTCVCK